VATWKQINEIGGTAILRVIAGGFALLALFGLGMLLRKGDFSLGKLGTLVAFLTLMGGYALLGNRFRA
jgi:hypothetical protein